MHCRRRQRRQRRLAAHRNDGPRGGNGMTRGASNPVPAVCPAGGPDRRLGRQRRQVGGQSDRHRAIDTAARRRFHCRTDNALRCAMAAAGFGSGMECGGQHSAMCSDHAWMLTRGRALRQSRIRRTVPRAPASVVPITHHASLRRRKPGQPCASATVSAPPRAWQDRCPSTARDWG